jgi:hypothetical protein
MELEEFDLPFRNPFQRENETLTHFKHRCDRTTAGLKRDLDRLYGGGGVYRNYYKQPAHSKSAKTPHRPGNAMR